MSEYALWVGGAPVPKERPRVVRGHAYTPGRTRAWEETIAVAWRQAYPGFEPLEGPLGVHVLLVSPKLLTGDLDNYAKSVLDGLNGLAWVDDQQIVHLELEKRRSWGSYHRGALVRVWETGVKEAEA